LCQSPGEEEGYKKREGGKRMVRDRVYNGDGQWS